MKNFKDFYYRVMPYYRRDFKTLPKYNRFIELMPRSLLYFSYLISAIIKNSPKSGVYFIDSTSLQVGHNKRIQRHKVFSGIAQRGKASMGWFFGLKLHLIIDQKARIQGIHFPPRHTHDTRVVDQMTHHLNGLLFADKGYLSKSLFESSHKRGLKLVQQSEEI